MRRIFAVGIFLTAALLMGSAAWAQSSGNVAFDANSEQCAISSSNGTLSGGSSNPGNLFTDSITTSNTSQAALVITPSIVTGLYTSNKLGNGSNSSTQNVGVAVQVLVDGHAAEPEPDDNSYVTYDQRFIQVSATFLSDLSQCSTDTCFTLTESTLSAHSFNFIYPDPGQGEHSVTVNWKILNGTSGEGACVGPATVTIESADAYKQDQ